MDRPGVNEQFKNLHLQANKGNQYAQLALAQLYEKVKKNSIKALRYYQLSANQGNPNAKNKIRSYKSMFNIRRPVSPAVPVSPVSQVTPVKPVRPFTPLTPEQLNLAVRHLNRAAQHGLTNAKMTLASVYDHGIGVNKNPSMASYYRTLQAKPINRSTMSSPQPLSLSPQSRTSPHVTSGGYTYRRTRARNDRKRRTRKH